MITKNESLLDSLMPFGVIETQSPTLVRLITDHAGSVPLYYSQQQDNVVTGRTSLEVAEQLRCPELDPVSVADFLLNGTVCYPYTLFKEVFVAPPGSVTEVTPNEVRVETYYVPKEGICEGALPEWGSRLRQVVRETLLHGIEGKNKVKVLFSGGEDSRAVASLLPREVDCELVTFADGYNREVRLAKRAASALARPHTFVQRPPNFYQCELGRRTRAIGGGFDVRYTHVWGVLAEALKDADVLIGGFAADAFFKTLLMGNVDRRRRRLAPESMGLEWPDAPVKVIPATGQKWLKDDIAAAVDERRRAHHLRLKEFRPRSAGNWHWLWPLGCHGKNYSQHIANQKVGLPVVEPFLSPQVYRLAATMPDEYRLDRKVLRAAFGRGMGLCGWLPTSSGRIPRLGGYAGHWTELAITSERRLRDLANQRLAKINKRSVINQGSWSRDNQKFYSSWFDVFSESMLHKKREILEMVVCSKMLNAFFKKSSEEMPAVVRNRALQVAYLIEVALDQ